MNADIFNMVKNAVAQQLASALGAMAITHTAKRFKKGGGSRTTTKKPTTTRRKAKTTRNNSNTIVLTKRRKTHVENPVMENRTVNIASYHRRPSVSRMLKGLLEPNWFRLQYLSQFDTTAGAWACANRIDGGGQHILPITVVDLFAARNIGPGGTLVDPHVMYQLFRTNTAAGAPARVGMVASQGADGVVRSNNSTWVAENTVDATDANAPNRRSFIEYSQIHLNLYGVRQRATKWYVELIQLKDISGDFVSASDTNIEKRKIYDSLARPLLFSNLNKGDPQTKADYRVLRRYETTIAPITTDEFNGANATPHMVTLKWFQRWNRWLDYSWQRDNVPATTQGAQFDQEESAMVGRVEPRHRVYLVIRALSPSQRTAQYDAAPDPLTEPSFDFMLRTKHSQPV
jgi:hypothetical protein